MDRYIQRNQYETTELDSEWLILNTDEFTVTKLNGVGGFCWGLLTEAQTIDSLVEAVKKNYSPEPKDNILKEDIENFLLHLKECRLISHVS
jgi:hypothetical protein